MGISVDIIPAHIAFSEQLGLTFPLLADFHPKAKMTHDYGLWFETWGTSRRAIIILDAEGIVRHVEVFKKGLPDMEQVLGVVQELTA